MGFVPIPVKEYVALHVKANPGENAAEFLTRLRGCISDALAGTRCQMVSTHLGYWVRVSGLRLLYLHYRGGVSERRLRD